MTTQTLPLLTTRIRQDEGDEESTLARQWRLLKLLAFAPKGFTIKELMAVSGMSEKTVRRDLAFLKEVGFDVSETVGDFGRKFFRISRLSESTGKKGNSGREVCLDPRCLERCARRGPDPWRLAFGREPESPSGMGAGEVSRAETKTTVRRETHAR